MLKAILVLAALGCLGWFGYQELDLGNRDAPSGPSVQYPVVDAGDGVGSVGDGTSGLLGP